LCISKSVGLREAVVGAVSRGFTDCRLDTMSREALVQTLAKTLGDDFFLDLRRYYQGRWLRQGRYGTERSFLCCGE
jgi:hypothetical protein